MNIEIEYREYRPGGYTDDLGIIADRNRWLPEQPAGWHVFIKHYEWYEIREWMDNNNIQYEPYFSSIILFKESDVVLFKLRWT